MLHLYNSATRHVEKFEPSQSGKVKLYTCGPTVYNYIHLGNLRTFLFEDFLRRWLEYSGYAVFHVKNITDIDDKTIAGAQAAEVSLAEFTEKYTQLFLEDTRSINILGAHQNPKATQYVSQMLVMISELIKKGLAYSTSKGNVYFRVKAGQQVFLDENAQLEAGASGRVDPETDKEQPADFALWKAWNPKDGDVFWDAPWGKGRPGWHIECSAMSLQAFHNQMPIDIHTGGIDLMFPHHQCEIHQSEGYLEQKFVNYWLHAAHLLIDGQKMSKSLGNFYTLRDVIAKGYDPLAVRYLLFSVHYRQTLNFTWESLDGAVAALQRWHDFIRQLENTSQHGPDGEAKTDMINQYLIAWRKQLDHDLNVGGALGELFQLMNYVNTTALNRATAEYLLNFFRGADQVYGMLIPKTEQVSSEIQKLLDERIAARNRKDWKASDVLREQLAKIHIIVEDTPQGQRWKRGR